MHVTKAAVIQTACDIADEKGLNNVSLKAVAEKLNIRTPSLYNHIGSIDDLLREAAHKGMRTHNERMMQVAVGNSGDAAIKSLGIEYLNFMIEHPGVYEIIQWATWHGTDETAEIFGNYISLLTTLIHSCQFKTEKTDEILNLLTGVLHGYTTLQLQYAFTNPDKVREDFCNAIDTVLLGIRQKYNQ
ncbi:TetR/AcrR family transcriptional regulator [Enterococcus faecium]|uniref:TetR/AcrR family transcriptional regulator n=1 Tax=Enterococcus faecium TaxID=1352 RepID=UPI0020066DD8|nr:TetR/AcrR family transcriptional regulator [Enterococcus faecium]MCK6016010.1 TetR/AcrR family transcriptional regulator [Enterococcus faecium]MCK6054216.1 TetR/AcrR family transcriptional regulator [Enterococcus faecium]MCZ9355811.1 TetR/AcrR family transcriptional regulator [Enterococcus faecium]